MNGSNGTRSCWSGYRKSNPMLNSARSSFAKKMGESLASIPAGLPGKNSPRGRGNVIPMKSPHNNPARPPIDRLHGTLPAEAIPGYPRILDIDETWRLINRKIRAQLVDLQKDLSAESQQGMGLGQGRAGKE